MVYKFEIIGILFAAIMIYIAYLEFKRKKLSKIELSAWSALWLAGISFIILHNYINLFLQPLNIVRVMDLYAILAFMLLFTIVFYLYLKTKRTENRIQEITRVIALKPLQQNK
jgi:hypothetical protein